MPQTPRSRPTVRTPDRHALSHQLREIIESRGLTAYAVAKLADVDPGVVSRFLTGRRDIRLETADRLARALGLHLVEVARRPASGRCRRRTALSREGSGQGQHEDCIFSPAGSRDPGAAPPIFPRSSRRPGAAPALFRPCCAI